MQAGDSDCLRSIELPRRLAIALLHLAQVAGADSRVALVAAPQAHAAPDRIRPLADASHAKAATAGLTAEDRVPWAWFVHRPQTPTTPGLADFAVCPGLPLLTASLATKGVLQLHAWRCVGDMIGELTLRVTD